MFKKVCTLGLAPLVTLIALGSSAAPVASEESAANQTAFEMLKDLSGDWTGTATSKDGPPASVQYRLTGGGSTVMETLFPGTDHEMISMYHMDGTELVLKHYCVMGNQPEMRLDPARSDSRQLVFVFTGGTNLDPDRDAHIHGGKIVFVDDDHIEAEWRYFEGGKETGQNRLFLARNR